MNTDPVEHNPAVQIGLENPWYTADQFVEQYQDPAFRRTIDRRWRLWESFMNLWREGAESQGAESAIRILDAGCGDGINLLGFLNLLHKRRLPGKICGMDNNPLRVGRAFQKFREVGILHGNLLDAPFLDEQFDIVLCNAVLEHIKKDEEVLKELGRILKKKGILIVGVPNEGCTLARMRNHYFQPNISRSTDHVQFYTWPILLDKFVRAGLVPVMLARCSFFAPHAFLSRLMSRYAMGDRLLNLLGRTFPGQVAEFQVCLRRKDSVSGLSSLVEVLT